MMAPRLLEDSFLTREERTSPVWASVRNHLQRMLEEKRKENDNPKLTDVETAALRGHIQMLKAFLVLGTEPSKSMAPDARPRPRIDLGAKYG